MQLESVATRSVSVAPMASGPQVRRSPLHLTVLGMLAGGPLHPYAIQRRMKAWGKDQVVDLSQRASLYKAIDRLRQAGLITVHKTEKDERFPERTVYELTGEGLRTGREWLREMLATHKDLAEKVATMEKKYDAQFRVVFDAIRKLLDPPPQTPRRPIGFVADEK